MWSIDSIVTALFHYLQLHCVLDDYAATGGESFPTFSTDTYYPIWHACYSLERDEEKCQALQRLLCEIATHWGLVFITKGGRIIGKMAGNGRLI